MRFAPVVKLPEPAVVASPVTASVVQWVVVP